MPENQNIFVVDAPSLNIEVAYNKNNFAEFHEMEEEMDDIFADVLRQPEFVEVLNDYVRNHTVYSDVIEDVYVTWNTMPTSAITT